MKKLLPILATGLVLTACENPLQTMKDMKKTTEEMAKTTAQMNQKMDETNGHTSELKGDSEQSFSEEKRDQKWDYLIPYDHMGTALTEAKILMLAFEYQIKSFSPNKEGIQYREELIAEALDEFFRKAAPAYEHLKDTGRLAAMTPLDLEGDSKRLERTFYALSTTMHFNNLKQEMYIEKLKSEGYKVEEISLYDIFKSALIKEANKKPLTENEERVLVGANRDMVIDMFQARMTFLSALAVKLAVTKDRMSYGDKAAALLFKATGGRKGALKLDSIFGEQNDQTRAQTLVYLDGAVKAKKVLELIGVEPKLQYEMKSVLENLEIETEADVISAQGVNENLPSVVSDSKRLSELREGLLAPTL